MLWGRWWVKLHRWITERERYTDGKTFRLFLHLIITANLKDKKYRGRLIKRGQRLTSILILADELNLSRQNIRTSLNKLKLTGEVTNDITGGGSLITVVKYGDYQDTPSDTNQAINPVTNQELTSDQPGANQELTITKECKESKECVEEETPTQKKDNFTEKESDQKETNGEDYDRLRRQQGKRNAEVIARHVSKQWTALTGGEALATDVLVKKIATIQATSPGIDISGYIKTFAAAVKFVKDNGIERHFYYPIYQRSIIDFMDKINKFTGTRDNALYATIWFKAKHLLKELLAKWSAKRPPVAGTPRRTADVVTATVEPADDPEKKARNLAILQKAKNNLFNHLKQNA